MDINGGLVRLRALRPDDTQAIVANVADPEGERYLDSWAWGPYGVERAQASITRRASRGGGPPSAGGPPAATPSPSATGTAPGASTSARPRSGAEAMAARPA